MNLIPEYNLHENRPAIILCEKLNVLAALTYKEVVNWANLIKAFLFKHIKRKNVGVGLKMTHNIYIPSIIISLKELELPFLFIEDKKCDESELLFSHKLEWILSLDIGIKNSIDSINLGTDDVLLLFKCESNSNPIKYDNIFYMIKTSGTTGDNKMVYVENNCIIDNINSLQKTFQINHNDVIYFGTLLTFDPSMIELLLSLRSGACLLMVPSKLKMNFSFLYQTLFPSCAGPNPGITILQIVPSIFTLFQNNTSNILMSKRLKILAFGGETFPLSILKRAKSDSLNLFNLYGITEVSCWASCHQIDINDENTTNVPIGVPLGDTQIQLRDDSGKVIEGDGKGTIFIGSTTRKCYLSDEKIITRSDDYLFRCSGDLGERKNGQIYCLGRQNDTVKRLGHKINLTRIENDIFEHTQFSNTCIWIENEQKVVCFLLLEEKQFDLNLNGKILDKIRIKLLHSLEMSQLPDVFQTLPRFPITKNGKIDKKSLEIFYAQKMQIGDTAAHDKQMVFRTLLKKYVGFEDENEMHLNSTFFDCGGNSILAIQMLEEFTKILNVQYPSELINLMYGQNLKKCLNYLNSIELVPQIEKTYEPKSKRVRTDGKNLQIRWKYNLGACVDSTPTIFHCNNESTTFVACGSFSHYFAILNANTGKEITKYTLPDAIESSATISPCLNYAYVGCFDGNVYCLACMTNQIKWVYQTNDRIKCKAVVCSNKKWIVFGSYDKNIYCVTINDGLTVWTTPSQEPVTATPLLNKNKIFIGTIGGTILCLDELTGRVLWTYSSESPIFGSPCLFANSSTIWPNVHGKIMALNNSGQKIWDYSVQGHIYSSLTLCNNDTILFGCHDLNLHIIKVNENEVMNSQIVDINCKISSTPFVYHDIVVVCTNAGKVLVLNLNKCDVNDKPDILYERTLDGEIFSSPILFEDKIYVGCRDDNLYCLDMPKLT